MKKVKSDIRMRKKRAIYRWIKSEGLFSGLVIDKIISLISTTTGARSALTLVISTLIQKFKNLRQTANMLECSKQNYLNACKLKAITNGGYSCFYSAVSSDYNQTLIRFFGKQIQFLK